MNDETRVVGYRHSPSVPYSYVTLSLHDADAIDRFVETNERPSVLMPGVRPTFGLCEHLRSAYPGLPRPHRIQYAVQWIARHGRPVDAWKTWTVDIPPAESDYDEPPRDATPVTLSSRA